MNEPATLQDSDNIDLVEYARILVRRKVLIVAVVLLGAVGSVIVSLLIPNKYQAQAVILPISAFSPASNLAGSLTSLMGSEGGALAGLAGLASGDKASGVLLSILSSRDISQAVVVRENLIPILLGEALEGYEDTVEKKELVEAAMMEDAIRILKGAHVRFAEIKERPTLGIYATFEDREVSERVIGAYLEELEHFINTNALTLAKRNRIFVEQQLKEKQADYLRAARELTLFFEGQGSQKRRNAIDVTITSSAVTTSDIAANAPETDKTDLGDDENLVVKDVPLKVYYDYLLKKRKVIESINSLLATQYEMAKINETKEQLTFQMIEGPVLPIRKISPHRALICVASTFAALALGIFLAFASEHVAQLRRNP